ncbi:MAG: hypothetical protein Kow0083_07570 [Methylophaga sp.]
MVIEKRLLWTSILGSLIAVSSSAYAEGAGENWNGLYGGIAFGGFYGKASPDTTVSDGTYFNTENISTLNSTFQEEISDKTLSGSALLGYDVQNGNLVYGIEVDLTGMNYSEKHSRNVNYVIPAANSFSVSTEVESNFALSIRPKIGYSFGDTMVHLAVGPTLSRFKYRFNFSDDATPAAASFSDEKTELGYSANLGGNHQLGDGWVLRGDYIYTYYPDIVDGSNLLSYPISETDVFSHDADFRSHNIRIGLFKRF